MVQLAVNVVKKLLLLAVLAALVAGLGAYQYFKKWLNEPMIVGNNGLVYELPAGGNLGQVANQLAGLAVLKHPQALVLYARLTGQASVRAGDYRFEPGTTPAELVTLLHTGNVIEYAVAIIEGWTYAEAVEALSRAPRVTSLLHEKPLEEQLALLDLPIEHPEGWFFPDTYHYDGGTTDVEIMRRAYEKMSATLNSLWQERDLALPYKTPYEALIMASIVERETGAAWERQKIAGVFVRRLQQNMRLQTDPTVIYGMGESYQGKISSADLRRNTPYNTYTNHGLTPTPIALPGEGALYASMHPESGQDLYFVAKGDGTHVFSATLDEHNKAVREYQLKRRGDYRSTLRP
ncbi:endolytic transglycosylase MltG [Gilvimarinus chinensis]|uniref:endolytic transglycosylase MltG n=1 Tax=Gilvimarinus chinensis TaxID=396005 RepID=UPI00035F2AA7|nr:endolytic transglycosylase MltG [Gilvimarinus chinensis]